LSGFEPMIPEIEREKTVHALQNAAISVGNKVLTTFIAKYTKKINQHLPT
jgi:hypothetical protein